MKSFKNYARLLLLSLGVATLVVLGGTKHKPVKKPLTPQQIATHILFVVNEGGEIQASCTATAIAPNVLMTAEHCIRDGADFVENVRVDRSLVTYHTTVIALDGRDHAVVELDTELFTNILDTNPANTLTVGEAVYAYGNGGGHYPARRLDGFVVDCEDPSDVDAAKGEVCFTLAAIPGDSGALIFDKDNNLVAILSLGTSSKNDTIKSIGFRVEENTFVPQAVEHTGKKKPENPFAGLF